MDNSYNPYISFDGSGEFPTVFLKNDESVVIEFFYTVDNSYKREFAKMPNHSVRLNAVDFASVPYLKTAMLYAFPSDRGDRICRFYDDGVKTFRVAVASRMDAKLHCWTLEVYQLIRQHPNLRFRRRALDAYFLALKPDLAVLTAITNLFEMFLLGQTRLEVVRYMAIYAARYRSERFLSEFNDTSIVKKKFVKMIWLVHARGVFNND